MRLTRASVRHPKKDFIKLFTLWHGRPPADDDFPVPRKLGMHGTYEWQAPEISLLASLVGRLGVGEITLALTNRLRERTGDVNAARTRIAVQVRINNIGMQSTDVLGGITTRQASREIGSLAIINQAISKKQLTAMRVGRLWVIPHKAWAQWKVKRVFPPKGAVQLSTLREALSIRSDKLSEFARMGLIPTAIRCNPYGSKGRSTQYGTWFVDQKVAVKLLADRRAGRPMPWHGKPNADNLRATFKLLEKRKHPSSCKTCAEIWGKKGAPKSFEDYTLRYPPLELGAKKHLTREFNPGLTIPQLAAQAHRSSYHVRRAIRNGMLQATREGERQHVSRTDATRWIARKCPTGEGEQSWISIQTAKEKYFFTNTQLREFIANKKLISKTGQTSTGQAVLCVSRHQCGQLREKIGFTEAQAARRAGVTIARLRQLLNGAEWRMGAGIPLATVQTVIKRLESRAGYTIEEAAEKLGTTVQWVHERKQDGTIRVIQAKWDRRRVYITEPMFQRLVEALKTPVKRQTFNADWLPLSDAAAQAGVSTTTLIGWAVDGDLERRKSSTGWRYHREAVRAQARKYWKTVRFHRATPPDWLQVELQQQRRTAALQTTFEQVRDQTMHPLTARRR